tara:strand:+ start:1477 stop:2022 length:546 start_codon:yes stop_codon:yes gene_type:complete
MPLPLIPPLTVAATAILRFGLKHASTKHSAKAIKFAMERLKVRGKLLRDRRRGDDIMTGRAFEKMKGPKPPRARQAAVEEGRIGQRAADTARQRARQAAVEEGRMSQKTADTLARQRGRQTAVEDESITDLMGGIKALADEIVPPTKGIPLKFNKGGLVPKTAKVRGAGKAIRGVRPAKLY